MKLTIIVLALVCAGTLAQGTVPQQINYQGQLASPSGIALDTTVAMTFKLYSDTTQPALWTEPRAAVTVQKGLFNVTLGEFTALTDAILNNPQVWLGITVGEMPRCRREPELSRRRMLIVSERLTARVAGQSPVT
jgi:hypothetical protein